MNVGLIILAQHEHDGAGAAQLRRSNDSVAAAAPSQQHYNLALKSQMVDSSCRPFSRCCQQYLEKGRGGTSRRDARCCCRAASATPQQHSSSVAS